MVEASLRDPEGTELVRARGWRLVRAEVEIPAGLASAEAAAARTAGRPSGAVACLPRPTSSLPRTSTSFRPATTSATTRRWSTGSATGAFIEPGPAAVWLRMRHPLISGEQPTPLQRVLIAADTGNGISATLDFTRYLFINVDLTVHLHRSPPASGSASTR